VAELDAQSGTTQSTVGKPRVGSAGNGWGLTATGAEYGDTGGASRFFPTFRYEAKAASRERPRDGDNAHPTVKPLALIQWLVRLVTPPGGLVLDCFAGSGTTGEAAVLEGIRCVLIERDATSVPLIRNRLDRRLDPVTFLRNTATEVTEATLFDKMEEISP
jgi:site-specific DNA-methyltransferase (adenine-specific)